MWPILLFISCIVPVRPSEIALDTRCSRVSPSRGVQGGEGGGTAKRVRMCSIVYGTRSISPPASQSMVRPALFLGQNTSRPARGTVDGRLVMDEGVNHKMAREGKIDEAFLLLREKDKCKKVETDRQMRDARESENMLFNFN